MFNFKELDLTKKQKYFIITFLVGFLFKYNYVLLRIFNVPSITGIIFKNIFFILLIGYFLVPLVKVKRGRVSLLVISILFSILCVANLWYNRHFGDYLSFIDVTTSEGVGSPTVLFRHIIKAWDIFFIVDVILLLILIIKDKGNKGQSSIASLFTMGKMRKRTVVIVLLLITQIFVTNLLLGNEGPSELYSTSSAAFVNVYGLLPLYFYEFHTSTYAAYLNIVNKEVTLPIELEDKINDKNLIDNKSNIIIIQMESLDEKVIGYKHNNQELTPFLNKLKDKSLYAENFYSQHVNGSFDADFSFLTSMYPINRNYSFKEDDMTKFESIVKVLKKKGYQTMAFHGNDKKFFHRYKAFPSLGFDKFYSREDFSSEDRIMDLKESYLGINDYDFFNQSLHYLEQADKPFFAYMITVSSHTPFTFYPDSELKEEYSDIENPLVHDYFQSVSFLDKSLEMFFDKLEQRGLAENTLFIIYADHEAGIDEKEYSSSEDFVVDRNINQPEHIPLFIKHRDIKAGIIEKTGTTTDIAPTILDIMGIEQKPKEFIGSSLLLGEEESVPFIHELPQVLYKEHIFIKDIKGLERVGYLKDRKEEGVELTEKEKNRILKIIDYMKVIMLKRRVDTKK
ncbi:hypothetical protein U472_01015 [Orenia metallireducens]|uniref:Sulfatase N-terminal domain-containing protein n=1 Tax=Orenia metallireducens TaxID=1413210 RepID=A0A1C0ACX4_9FIRM|nr:LTA synthase family protein [Orenia metallireducens]OCL28498.1 hypothetical protein U472_01015 [Orenia metallireducens]